MILGKKFSLDRLFYKTRVLPSDNLGLWVGQVLVEIPAARAFIVAMRSSAKLLNFFTRLSFLKSG